MRPYLVLLVVLIAPGSSSGAADQHARRLDPAGMPVRLEAVTISGADRVLTWGWRNGTQDILYPRMRVFAFDGRGQLLGSTRYCLAEPLQPGTRARGTGVLDIAGVTVRHRFVAVIEEVASERTIWQISGSPRDIVNAARRMAAAERAELNTVTRASEPEDLTCACECETAEALADEGCGETTPVAFTCEPAFFPDGCRMGYSCAL